MLPTIVYLKALFVLAVVFFGGFIAGYGRGRRVRVGKLEGRLEALEDAAGIARPKG